MIHKNIQYEIDTSLLNKIVFLNKKRKKDISPFVEFYKISKKYKPDFIHTWSSMVTFYSIFSVLFLRINLVNSQITNAPPLLNVFSFLWLISKINFFFSKKIISNSYAGLNAYNVKGNKGVVIYNGVHMDRFIINRPIDYIKNHFNINTKYCIAMVASFSDSKDYSMFFGLAEYYNVKNPDITFLAIGDGLFFKHFKDLKNNKSIDNIIMTGNVNNVEEILKICDIGILISNNINHGEGISNSIIEYMASNLPVLANDSGGTKEILLNGYNGFLIEENIYENFIKYIDLLLSDEKNRNIMAMNAYNTISKSFNIDIMFKSYMNIYKSLLEQ